METPGIVIESPVAVAVAPGAGEAVDHVGISVEAP